MQDSPTDSRITLTIPWLLAVMTAAALAGGSGVWVGKASQPAPVCDCHCAAEPVAAVPRPPVPREVPPPPPRPSTRPCRGMTWVLTRQEKGVARVGNDANTNAYAGDTSCDEQLSVLCFKPGTAPKPEGVASDFYSGWSGGEVTVTPPVPGSQLTSRAVADALCASRRGDGFRMAEHHDGHGGWGLAAFGELPRNTRFWVAIDDQRSNPWN